MNFRIKSIKEGDFFMVDNNKFKAYQVMEVWENVMTVKCKGGCLTLPYDRFTKIKSTDGFSEINIATWFENRIDTTQYQDKIKIWRPHHDHS